MILKWLRRKVCGEGIGGRPAKCILWMNAHKDDDKIRVEPARNGRACPSQRGGRFSVPGTRGDVWLGGSDAGALGVPQPREKAEGDHSLLYTENDGIIDAAGDASDPPTSGDRVREDQPEAAAAVSQQVHGSRFRAAGRIVQYNMILKRR